MAGIRLPKSVVKAAAKHLNIAPGTTVKHAARAPRVHPVNTGKSGKMKNY